MKRTYNHTKQFYTKKYNQYKREVFNIGGTPLKKNEFISGYNALSGESKNVMRDLIYASKYGTAYKTALAEYRALKTAGVKASLESLKIMTTTDFASTYAAELAAGYKRLRVMGHSGKDAKTLISQQWFGSN